MRNKGRWILAGLAALLFVAGGLSRIGFDVEILRLLPAQLSQVHGLSLLLKYFALPDELMITVEAPTAETAGTVADALGETLARHPDLVRRVLARPPWENAPEQMGELLAFQLLNQPPDQLAALLRRLDPTHAPTTLRESLDDLTDSLDPRTMALRGYDPYGLTSLLPATAFADGANEFTSADGTFRVVYAESARPLGNYADAIRWMAAIKKIVAESPPPAPGVRIGFTGQPAFVADISGSMQGEMSLTAATTLALIAAIFWLCYRRLRPLLLLLAMLALTFVLSLAIAGWALDHLTVMAVGFASVMIGLSVDYGYFVFHQATRHPAPLPELRRRCLANIVWTCSTTAAVFFALSFSRLPGLSQLGSLVGIGVLVGAAVMLGIFAPLTLWERARAPGPVEIPIERILTAPRFLRNGAWATLALVVVLLTALLFKGLPELDFSANTMRPRVSDAYASMDRLTTRLSSNPDTLNLVVTGSTPGEVAERLRQAEQRLAAAVDRGEAASFQTALPLWPEPDRQRRNLATAGRLAADIPRLRQSLLDAGFTESASGLAESVLRQWQAWSGQPLPIWPANTASTWTMRRLAFHDDKNLLAGGLVIPVAGRESALVASVASPGVYLVSWAQLGRELHAVVPGEMLRLIGLIFAGVVTIVALGLRSGRAVLLFVATTALVLFCLAGATTLLGGKLGLFSLAAVLLLLGTGTDYSILLLLAIRRNGGDPAAAQRELALVILLCSSSAVAGFGSISWANNLGLAELGRTCALGLGLDALISLFLLPPAWRWLHGSRANKKAPA